MVSCGPRPCARYRCRPCANVSAGRQSGHRGVRYPGSWQGVQIYTFKVAGGHYAWALKAPDAPLTDRRGRSIGKHFAGPTWQATDGSTVVGELLNSSPSPDVAIAWLVRHAKSHAGQGVMANVDYVVRTRTEGGVATADGCDASHPGAEVRVPYSAIYLFFPHTG